MTLQGANLAGAKLQGADLSYAHLQGANLFRAELPGAQLSMANLQGASLMRAKVWRTLANPAPTIDPSELNGIDPVSLPWQEPGNTTQEDPIRQSSQFRIWVNSVFELLPADYTDQMKAPFMMLDPHLDEQEIEQKTRPLKVLTVDFWREGLLNPPQTLERHKTLSTFVAELGCASTFAPYVARGLVLQGTWALEQVKIDPMEPRADSDVRLVVLTERLQKSKTEPAACPGAKGFTDDDWEALYRIIAGFSKPAHSAK